MVTSEAFLGARSDRWATSQGFSADIGVYGAPSGAFASHALAQWSHLPVIMIGASSLAQEGGGRASSVHDISASAGDGAKAAATLSTTLTVQDGGMAGTLPAGVGALTSHYGQSIASSSSEFSPGTGTPPTGVTSTIMPQPLAQPVALVSDGAAALHSGGSSEAAIAAVQHSAAQLEQVLANLTSQFHSVSAASLAGVAQVHAQAAGLIGQMSELTRDTVVEPTRALVDETVQAVGALTDEARDSVEQTVALATDTVSGAVAGLSDGVQATVADTAQTVQSIGAVAASLPDGMLGGVEAVHDSLFGALALPGELAALMPDTGLLDDVGGLDPVAGFSTLSGMVSAADFFAFPDNGDALTQTSPIDAAIGMAASLADLAPETALLGIDHHDGLLGGIAGLDDHHHGLGLGL